ncbi:MAG: hypothetical protein L0Z62_00955 [Gemmataceae bacterium]|nr:hypothetical protein [Gemmataceae bacterium]
MNPAAGKAPITIRLELSIPTDLGAAVQIRGAPPRHRMKLLAASVTYPPDASGQAQARPLGDRYVICARGLVGGARHVAVRVYPENNVPLLGSDPDQSDPLVRFAFVYELEYWQIDEVPVEGLGNQILVLWSEQDGSYEHIEPDTSFEAVESTSTYCETYPRSGSLRSLRRKAWSRLPDRWRFQLAGCANRGCSNCACLNGDWVVTRDRAPGALRWYHALDRSFADAPQPCYWRLIFNERDGFWYLDCVGSLEQLPGTWISYRLHESAWNPGGPNSMQLVTDSGYCHVPDTVTLVPA